MRCVIEFAGKKPRRLVGPFETEAIALAWYTACGADAKVSFHTLEYPELEPGSLPKIPRRHRLTTLPKFVREPTISDEWLVVGRADNVVEGTEVEVENWSQKESTPITIGQHVAERMVRHQGRSEPTRYVLATIEHILDEKRRQ